VEVGKLVSWKGRKETGRLKRRGTFSLRVPVSGLLQLQSNCPEKYSFPDSPFPFFSLTPNQLTNLPTYQLIIRRAG